MPNRNGRISEFDLLIPTLEILAAQPNGFMTTSQLIDALTEALKPSGQDAEILDGRQDTRFSQIVRNMISHKTSPGNIIAEGFAEHDDDLKGLRITVAGLSHLKNKR